MNIEVRRNVRLAAALGAASGLVAIAYLTRAVGDPNATDWLVFAVLATISGFNLAACWDARTPLFVADDQGVRLRRGRSWRGLQWDDIDAVEVLGRRRLRDGAVDVLTAGDEEPISVPLALSTRVAGLEEKVAESGVVPALVEAMAQLADGRADVVEIEGYEYVGEEEWAAGRHDLIEAETAYLDSEDTEHTQDIDQTEAAQPAPPALVATPTPSPLREPQLAVRAEAATQARELHRPGSVDLVEDTVVWMDRPSSEPELAPVDPVIGPQLAGARSRLGLSVEQLGERTRIRPHVIESIEVDDFGPCGGDFYARGHLRTLARVLGVDAGPLISVYDERYADAPIDPRRVFEAELGTAAIRSARGGPNWSVLVAGVMAVILAWSVVRLVSDSPVDLKEPLPGIAPAGSTVAGGKVPVTLTAAGGGARVIVRDAENRVVFQGSLTFGQSKTLAKVAQPVRIQTSDGSLEVTLDGHSEGAMGRTGHPAQATFVTR